MGEHSDKWWAAMVAKHGSEKAVREFMKTAAKKAKHTGGGGFAYMKQHHPDKLREIAVKGGKNGRRTKELET